LVTSYRWLFFPPPFIPPSPERIEYNHFSELPPPGCLNIVPAHSDYFLPSFLNPPLTFALPPNFPPSSTLESLAPVPLFYRFFLLYLRPFLRYAGRRQGVLTFLLPSPYFPSLSPLFRYCLLPVEYGEPLPADACQPCTKCPHIPTGLRGSNFPFSRPFLPEKTTAI